MMKFLPCLMAVLLVCGSARADHKIYSEHKLEHMGHDIAQEIINTVKQNQGATIILPYGPHTQMIYQALEEKFAQDTGIDFSKANWVLPGEYMQFSTDHPLSVGFFVRENFLTPLQAIDSRRAPQFASLPQKSSVQIDLAVLEAGSAYPTRTAEGKFIMKGGDLAFNEPGCNLESTCRTVWLSDEARKQFSAKMTSLKTLKANGEFQDVSGLEPESAIAIGLKDIMRAKEIHVLAVGEDHEAVVREVFSGKVDKSFPATVLTAHQNVTWYMDEHASQNIKEYPWNGRPGSEYSKDWFEEALYTLTKAEAAKRVTKSDFDKIGYDLAPGLDLSSAIETVQLKISHNTGDDVLPSNKRVLVVSPHPDDDVISAGATIYKLRQRGNDVHVLYTTSGSVGVRSDFPMYKKVLESVPEAINRDRSDRAKEIVRECEASSATRVLGVPAKNLHFFRADFYFRRGIVGVNPLTKSDVERMKDALVKISPDLIFFAAENDPHGTHGLAKELLAQAAYVLHDRGTKIWGYRGAYNEWPLYDAENLRIVYYSKDVMDLKQSAIKTHRSQINPLFTSFDSREFYQRAYDRNTQTAARLGNMLDRDDFFAAEVFRAFTLNEFIQKYAPRTRS